MAKRLTYEEVKRYIEVESGSGCKLLSEEYMNSKEKLLIKCKCGNNFEKRFGVFKYKNHTKCKHCTNNMDITYERVKHYIETESKSGCKLISKDCKSNAEKLIVQCKCGDIFKPTFNSFRDPKKMRQSCKKCRMQIVKNNLKLSYEEVKNYVEVQSKSGCKLLSKEFNNCKDKLLIRCKCGSKFEKNFDNFKNKNQTQCNECSDCIKWDYDKIKHYIEIKSKSGCKLLSNKYINGNQKLLIKCKCGNTFKRKFNIFKYQKLYQCEKCSNCVKWSYERVKKYIEIESKSGCKLLSDEYYASNKKLLLKCKCGAKFEKSFAKFKGRNEAQCRICSISRGEKRIVEWLENNCFKKDMDYIHQKSFDNLRGISNGLLSYDFYLSNFNLLIEYQGEYHDGTPNNQTEIQFKKQQEHDRRKKEYAKKHNIELLEIWYWQYDKIESILDKWLKKYELIKEE